MEKKTANSIQCDKLTLRLVLCLIFITAGAANFTVTAQTSGQDSLKYWKLNTVNDYFWEPHCPTSSALIDGLSLWLLRQKMTLEAYQTILNSEVNLNNKNIDKIQFTNYMPFISKGNFHSMIGTQYSKTDIESDNEYNLSKSLQHVWLWTAWQYRYKRWNITLTTENYYKGDETSLYTKMGNQFMTLLYIGYELNNYWDIIVFGGYNKQQMVGQTEEEPKYAIQVRYQPSSKLKLLFGAPVIFAAEWTAFPKTDIGMRYFISNESLFFIRQRLSNLLSISLQYNSSRNHSYSTYFNNTTFNPGNGVDITYNKISYLQHQLFADINFKLYKDIGFSIGAGYNFSNKINLCNNNNKVYDAINSKDNIFVNCSLQFARLK